MASFDIIESAGKAYHLAWKERLYFARMAIVPVLVRLVCYVALFALGWEQDYLKQALLMLPAFFTEGWLLSHLVRLIFLDQRWPFRPSGDEEKDMKILDDRARGVMGGTVLYALINFLVFGLIYVLQSGQSPMGQDAVSGGSVAEGEITLGAFVMAFAGFVSLIWAFRFIWLYIPAAVNYPVSRFLKHIEGFSTSFYMVGVWMICFVPVMFVLFMLTSYLVMPYQGNAADMPATLDFFLSILQTITNMIVAIISTAGMAYGMQSVIEKNAKDRR